MRLWECPLNTSPFIPQSFWVEGMSAVAEYLKWKPSAVKEIHCNPKEQEAVKRLLAGGSSRIPIVVRSETEKAPKKDHATSPRRSGRPDPRDSQDSRRGESDSTAPVAAKVALNAQPAQDWLARLPKTKESVILALDHVQDPRNMGAIFRSAGFFGVRSVLVPERRQVLLTQASVATAQGGFAVSDLVCAVNLPRALRELKDLGYWIIGATMDGEPLAKVAGVYDKVVVVLGAEESGISRIVLELCDRKVSIKGAGQLDSLNVSVAAGIVLNAFANSHLTS